MSMEPPKPNRATRRHPPKARTIRVKLPPTGGSPIPAIQRQLSSIGGGAPAGSLPEAEADADEESTISPQPKAERADRPPSGRKRGRPPKESADDRIYTMLVQLYAGAGLLVYPFSRYDGEVIAAKAEDCAKGWIAVARLHKEVYRALEMLSVGGPYLLLASSHLAIVAAIASNHQIIPTAWASRLGGPRVSGSPEQAGQTNETPPSQEEMEHLARMVAEEKARAAAVAQATAQGGTNGVGYDPSDSAARPEQNPAVLMQTLGTRRE